MFILQSESFLHGNKGYAQVSYFYFLVTLILVGTNIECGSLNTGKISYISHGITSSLFKIEWTVP